jgi:hypothetical protein
MMEERLLRRRFEEQQAEQERERQRQRARLITRQRLTQRFQDPSTIIRREQIVRDLTTRPEKGIPGPAIARPGSPTARLQEQVTRIVEKEEEAVSKVTQPLLEEAARRRKLAEEAERAGRPVEAGTETVIRVTQQGLVGFIEGFTLVARPRAIGETVQTGIGLARDIPVAGFGAITGQKLPTPTLTSIVAAARADPLGFGAVLGGAFLGGRAFGKVVGGVETRVRKPQFTLVPEEVEIVKGAGPTFGEGFLEEFKLPKGKFPRSGLKGFGKSRRGTFPKTKPITELIERGGLTTTVFKPTKVRPLSFVEPAISKVSPFAGLRLISLPKLVTKPKAIASTLPVVKPVTRQLPASIPRLSAEQAQESLQGLTLFQPQGLLPETRPILSQRQIQRQRAEAQQRQQQQQKQVQRQRQSLRQSLFLEPVAEPKRLLPVLKRRPTKPDEGLPFLLTAEEREVRVLTVRELLLGRS